MKAMVDVVRAAQLLGMSRERAIRLILTGALKGTRQNGRWQVEMDSVTRVLREREGEHATGAV